MNNEIPCILLANNFLKLFLLKIHLFVWKADLGRSIGSLPNSCNSESWNRLEPRTRNSIWVSPTWDPDTGVIFHYFAPAVSRERDWKKGSQGTNQCLFRILLSQIAVLPIMSQHWCWHRHFGKQICSWFNKNLLNEIYSWCFN